MKSIIEKNLLELIDHTTNYRNISVAEKYPISLCMGIPINYIERMFRFRILLEFKCEGLAITTDI